MGYLPIFFFFFFISSQYFNCKLLALLYLLLSYFVVFFPFFFFIYTKINTIKRTLNRTKINEKTHKQKCKIIHINMLHMGYIQKIHTKLYKHYDCTHFHTHTHIHTYVHTQLLTVLSILCMLMQM